jgi:ketosteroid isomerase-like protein
VHEFGFRVPDGTRRLEGAAEVRSYYRQRWSRRAARLERIHSRQVHVVGDGAVVVDEWHGTGRRADGAPFALDGVLVLRSEAGRLVHVRDYMDVYGLLSQTTGVAVTDAGPAGRSIRPTGRSASGSGAAPPRSGR